MEGAPDAGAPGVVDDPGAEAFTHNDIHRHNRHRRLETAPAGLRFGPRHRAVLRAQGHDERCCAPTGVRRQQSAPHRVASFFLTNSRKGARLHVVQQPTDFQQMLRGVDLRVTKPRLAVLAAVHGHPHADTDSLIRVVRHDLPDVSHQTVYDSLNALTAAGLVRRIQPTGSVARYESRVGDNHHHVVCRSCGVIADVDCAVGDAPCLNASDEHGFTIDEAEVIYWGVCPDCSTARSS